MDARALANTVRLYNTSKEDTGEGFPIRIDYAGDSVIIQPSDADWAWESQPPQRIERDGRPVVVPGGRAYRKLDTNKIPPYVEVTPEFARYAMLDKHYDVARGCLKAGAKVRAEIDTDLAKARDALTAARAEAADLAQRAEEARKIIAQAEEMKAEADKPKRGGSRRG